MILKPTNPRVSFVCQRSAAIRKGTDITQHDAMVQAHFEWKSKIVKKKSEK